MHKALLWHNQDSSVWMNWSRVGTHHVDKKSVLEGEEIEALLQLVLPCCLLPYLLF